MATIKGKNAQIIIGKIVHKWDIIVTGVRRVFVFYYYFQSWNYISFGFHIDIATPNIEIHLPFGFIRIGLEIVTKVKPVNYDYCKKRAFGIGKKYY